MVNFQSTLVLCHLCDVPFYYNLMLLQLMDVITTIYF